MVVAPSGRACHPSAGSVSMRLSSHGQVDTCKWAAGRLAPKKYGDHISHDVKGPGANPAGGACADRQRRARGRCEAHRGRLAPRFRTNQVALDFSRVSERLTRVRLPEFVKRCQERFVQNGAGAATSRVLDFGNLPPPPLRYCSSSACTHKSPGHVRYRQTGH